MKYIVRLADISDIDWLVDVAGYNMLSFEVGHPEWFNREHIVSLANKSIHDKTCFIATFDDEPVGVLGGIIVPNTFNPQFTVLSEILWYVLPKHRKSRCGYLLMKQYSEVSTEMADSATMSLLVDSSELRIESIERFGFKLKELGFYKER